MNDFIEIGASPTIIAVIIMMTAITRSTMYRTETIISKMVPMIRTR